MARQKTLNPPPIVLGTRHYRSPKSTFKRSPLTSRLNKHISGGRSFRVRPTLQSIQEEDIRYPDLFSEQLVANDNEQNGVNAHDGGGVFDWEEEQTLVAALLQDESEESERVKITELANGLQGAMSNQSFKQDFAKILVPTYTIVKDAFVELDTKIDFAFAEGIFTFDDASKGMEKLVIKEEDEVAAGYSKTKNNIKALVIQLEQLHKRREELWANLQETIKQSVEPLLAEVNAFPAEVERKISELDKLNKDLNKDNDGPAKQEKMLKALLAKFV